MELASKEITVCTFYQKGACSYGSRCRYEHVEARRNHPQPSTTAACAASDSSELVSYSGRPHCRECQTDVCNQTQKICKPTTALSSRRPAWTVDCDKHNNPEDGNSCSSNQTAQNQISHCLAHLPICSFAAAGTCPYGKDCSQIHGDICAFCEKQCLHPCRPDESRMHIKLCKKNNRRLEALRKSEEIECGVCLDRVLSKPTAAERRFGLLSDCDHSFCISCIRNWRSTSPSSGMDVNSTLRACPICRKLSYYVVPSVMWYSSKEEKQEIVDGYKAKLKSIDCKYFDFGKCTCPFGSRCFYKHAYRDGTLEEVVLHQHDDGDRSTTIAKDIRLSYLLTRLHI
ncbi:E3 ubiquitin-protein ligase makorin-like isoform X2 [Phragmites australis]|uniref:E3 ubiquitin-protein ligase makorin-like isoform X2 n=1 Tax=Phragmites australis TaxID=29695 RepID=UPI002D78780E|nr:E3 ubiquitin-protein ligase makorin-like isoform X2 [Phragmites australis]